VKAIKYIHKYIYKGHDLATLAVGQNGQVNDEIQDYIDGRYIGPVEACWHVFEFPMHEESPTVYRLPVHLQDQQTVIFNDGDNADEVADLAANKDTQLMGWFKANQTFPDACHYTYQDFPQYFVWNKQNKKWTARRQGFAIGRLTWVHPSSGERFYLRTLLTMVKGAKDWDDLRTFNGIIHPTYKAVCLARGLLEDDGEWDHCLREAGVIQTGSQLRILFTTILMNCNPTSPEVLWNHHREHICDDLRVKLINHHNILEPTQDQVYDHGLFLLNTILLNCGRNLTLYPPMPLPVGNWQAQEHGNQLLHEQLDFDPYDLLLHVQFNRDHFNVEQRAAYDAVMHSVNNRHGNAFFLHSAGGGGKTFVCNTVAATIRANNKVAITVASSAVAALILVGGSTAHRRFKIPIPIFDNSTCRIEKQGELAEVLRQTDVIIWDEAPMQHRHAIEALDRTLQDIMDTHRLFGGITMLFGGDFRQTTPVIPRASREKIVNASIKRSSLWEHIQVLHLTQNMRLDRTPESDAFAAWLLEVGAGRGLGPQNTINLPPNMRMPQNTMAALVNNIYPGIAEGNKPDDYFLNRTILSPTNSHVDELNKFILDMFPGEETVIRSIDKVVGIPNIYPIEFLNAQKSGGLPLAHLSLKVGCPLMLLRNIDVSNGLCNGTRMILLDIQPRVLQCRIIGGKHAAKIVFIPRITIQPSDDELGLPLSRHQFPVRLAFAMTINKSQGQSVIHVGVDLRSPAFSHGQLYVALSRCTSGDRIKVLFPDNSINNATSNIVFRELLSDIL
jgi:hypothetical protein